MRVVGGVVRVGARIVVWEGVTHTHCRGVRSRGGVGTRGNASGLLEAHEAGEVPRDSSLEEKR